MLSQLQIVQSVEPIILPDDQQELIEWAAYTAAYEPIRLRAAALELWKMQDAAVETQLAYGLLHGMDNGYWERGDEVQQLTLAACIVEDAAGER